MALLLSALMFAGCQHGVEFRRDEPPGNSPIPSDGELTQITPQVVDGRADIELQTMEPSVLPRETQLLPQRNDIRSGLNSDFAWRPVAYLQGESSVNEPADRRGRFSVPEILPGADAPPLQLPRFDPSQTPSERRAAFEGVFAPVPPPPVQSNVPVDGAGRPFNLEDLQQIAFENSPVVRRAAADLQAAQGLAVQAGAYPNPAVGYLADTANTADTSGYQGGFIAQEFVTGKKLRLARCAAEMEALAAEFALQRAQIELISNVRRGYFAVLVAQRRVELMRALAELSGDAYQAFIDLVAGGEAAAYEPLQFRVFALQARNKVVRAENEYLAAWRELAATVGIPDLAPGKVEGTLDETAPQVDYQAALSYLLGHHTNLAIANARIDRAALNLRLQRVTPLPNVDVEAAVTYDDTSPLNDMAYSLQIGLPIPVFNRNRGNIAAGEAELMGAQQDWSNTRNDLVALLAQTYSDYSSSRTIAEAYRGEIIREQVRTYRGIYDRFRQAGDNLDFSQIVVSQQALFEVVDQYLIALDSQWQALVELARVLQLHDLGMLDALDSSAVDTLPAPADRR
ncbi:MAG: TolC family protein [Planctomycetes bacterium]|nr:TolC family protein [Planctomycetota bacterium]